jgi:ABC-type transporter Mla subunit MlaD
VLKQVDGAVARVDGVLDGAEGAVVRVDGVVHGAEGAVTRVNGVLDGADVAVARTSRVLDGAEGAVQRADRTLDSAGAAVDRASALLAQAEPPLERLLPVLRRMAETLDEEEVDAAVLLIDRLPQLLSAVDDDVLPVVRLLKNVGPELHELLEIVEDLHRLATGLPGAKLLRRRNND